MSKETTRRNSKHEPPIALLAIAKALLAADYIRKPHLGRLAEADAIAARALAKPHFGGFEDDGYSEWVEIVAEQFGKQTELADIAKWAQEDGTDAEEMRERLLPLISRYIDAGFMLGLSLGHRLTVPGGVR